MFEEKIRCFNKYFGAFFLPFRANYGFPVVVHGRPEGTEGRTDGNVRTRGIPVSVHEKWTRWIYHFFLAMVLRSRGPSGRTYYNLISKDRYLNTHSMLIELHVTANCKINKISYVFFLP